MRLRSGPGRRRGPGPAPVTTATPGPGTPGPVTPVTTGPVTTGPAPVQGAMAGAMVRIGDQLILEEDYDETYIPSEQEIQDFARDIGIDPEKEPELMWLAKEGIVAPLPPEWKPCQDITGDIYYFNFANGQSMWDHPCDDHYRELVAQERKKLLARGGLKKKEKKKKDKKEKKDKKDKQSPKRSTEMQPGILPSTPFCQIPCAILSPGQESPEPEPDSQIRNEGLFDKGKGRASCVTDSWRQFADMWPNNLHPILVSEFSSPCQTLTDAVKILGNGPPFGSFDVDIHQEQGIPLAIQENLCSSSDSQSDDVEVRPTVQPLHVLKKSCSQDFENVQTPPESPEDKILLFDEKLKGKQKIKDVMDDCVRKSDRPFSAGEKSTGPGGDVKRSPSLLQAREERFYCRNLEMTLFDASATNDWGLQETVDAPHAREELSSRTRVSQSRSKRKVQGGEALAQATSLRRSNESSSRPEREGSKQMDLTKLGVDTKGDGMNGVLGSLPTAPAEIVGTRHCFQGIDAKGGTDVGLQSAVHPTSKHVFSSAKDGCKDDERGGLMSECDSSDLDSSQNDNAPQILGVSSLHNESGRPKDVYSVTEEPVLPCPVLGSSLSQILSPAEESERECSSKDMKLCHALQECEEGASPEPDCVSFLVDSCGKCTAQESNGAGVQTEVKEENGRTDQAPGAWGDEVPEELQLPPEYLRQMADCQGSTSLCQHVEAEVTQTRQTAENCSKIEAGEGAGGNESSGSPLAPVQAPLGNLAPLRGPVASPAGILRGSLNSDVGSSVDSSLAARGETRPAEPCKPTGHTKKLLGLVCEEKSSLNTVPLDKGRNEEEESENESLRGTRRLFKNLHMDVSALGGSFESELSKASETSECVEDLQASNRSDHDLIQHMDLAFQSHFSEQVLDVGVLSPVLDSPMCKAQELGGEEKDQSKASIEEEQSKRTKAAERQPEKEIKQEQSLSQPSEESLEEIAKELEKEIEREKMHLLQAKEEKIQQFQEEMRQQEEEEAQKLHQQKEKSLRTLKEDLAKVSEEEELRVRKEETERLSKLRAKIASETEAEKEKIRAEQEFMLQKLREEWESLQVTEKKSLERKKQLVLEKMKLEMEEAQQEEMVRLEEEKEQFLRELKERLETEKRKATEELEKQFATELQQLKSAAEEKHQKAISSLQTQAAEAQRSKETWLHEDLQRAEQKTQQKAYQVMAYEHELSELMREKRQGVEKDHERKMERMKEEHQEVLARIQDQYEEEERKQRAELFEGLRSEMARLRQLHEVEVKALQAELDERLTLLQSRHREKERKLQDSENELEIRAKNVKARSVQLLSQEESLRKKRQQLLDEDRRTELERDEAALASQLRLEENRKEHTNLLESIRQLRRSLEELQDQKSELEAQVDLLQTRSQRLQKRISELEAAVRSKQEILKELEAEESVESPRRKAELHVEDLRETIQAHSSRESASPPSQSHEDSNLQFDHVRSYISAEGISIRNAKEFLVRQTRSMRKRHTALKAAKQQWHQDMQKAQEVVQDLDSSQLLEGVRKNLEEEAKQLDKMKSVMRKGQVLLKKKEEKLSQLESSLLEELSDEDTLKSTACKKMVTFDLSNSEDTNSMSSASLGQPKFDLRTDLQVGPQLDKIQCLTDSLQHITRELNGVLGVLSSLNNRQSPLFTSTQVHSNGVPLSTYASLAGLQAGGSLVPPAGVSLVDQWVRSTGLSSSRSFTAGQTVDSILAEKWHKYFPGGFPSLSGSSGTLDNKLGYVPADEQIRLFQHSQFQSCESDKMSIQGMIETNKKWLEDFKRDSKVPLFPGAQKPSASSPSLLQLGLDENRQIKVYHY
ncbi:centrosomal protein of 164 kDa isoform X1 [Cygnus atratus]|uniref:centrosomal protein of 164 kDa isoform X1 n=1 Tax=Cygnus atratus TaxID=8868 RepID=UPI0021B82842|nr:centrosomal protein of 164 kDa isoform X1 [Cygnus atratus]XP_050571034.1 centrosomal protein of 164 kDa isoform X1 [Cygnus atratus]